MLMGKVAAGEGTPDSEPGDPAVLHVYAQYDQHQPVLVIGNRKGLLYLREAIDWALESPLDGEGRSLSKPVGESPCTSDGEGFEIYVWREETPWQGETWQGFGYPYVGVEHLNCEVPRLPAVPWNPEDSRRV